jgi:hypothetical protein
MHKLRFTWSALLVAAALCVPVAGCGGYGAVSPVTYEYAKALYSITNRKAEDKLADVEAQITAASAAGKMSADEANWLMTIVADAKSGDWETANQAARQIMEDQIK